MSRMYDMKASGPGNRMSDVRLSKNGLTVTELGVFGTSGNATLCLCLVREKGGGWGCKKNGKGLTMEIMYMTKSTACDGAGEARKW